MQNAEAVMGGIPYKKVALKNFLNLTGEHLC